MKYKNIPGLILAVIFFTSSLHAGEKAESFAVSKEKWDTLHIKEYYIKVNYNSFSPISGVWELKVKNGIIYNCIFNGKPAEDYIQSAGIFTMEHLYKTAGQSAASDKKGAFVIKATYGKDGLINSLSKIRNPEYKKSIQKDTTYRIEVLDFRPVGD